MFNRSNTFARYSWLLLVYTLAVIAWGAYVRATGSGAGCGSHWPLCNGEVVPRSAMAETRIEFTHRAMSGVMAIAVVLLWLIARKSVGPRHPAYRSALLACGFLLLEILLGALLVKGPSPRSAGGIAILSVHSTNTLLLVAALAMTAWFARGKYGSVVAGTTGPKVRVAFCLGLIIAAAITGAIAAKGDTLFVPQSLTQGLAQDLSTSSSYLLRLRLLHPAAALLAAGFAVWLFWQAVKIPALRAGALGTGCLLVLQLCLGLMNIVLLAPIWLQLVHLIVADLLWISLILLSWNFLEQRTSTADAGRRRQTSSMAG